MAETGTIALAGLAGFAAAEVAGVTNVTGQGGQGDPGGQVPIQVPSQDSLSPERVRAIVEDSVPETPSGPDPTTLALLSNMGNQQPIQLPENLGSGGGATKVVEKYVERVRDAGSGGGGGGGGGGSSGGGGGGGMKDWKLQDLANEGDLGTAVATVGEAGKATGEAGNAAGSAINDTVETMTKAGNSIGQATRALAGKEYDTNNTFYGDVTGDTGKKRIYQGSLAEKAGEAVNDVVPGTPAAASSGSIVDDWKKGLGF